MRSALCALIFTLIAPAAQALTLVDDFNDGSTAGWTDIASTTSEAGGLYTGAGFALATRDNTTGFAAAVDAAAPSGIISYVAIVLGFASETDNLFVKLQDNNGDNLFDRVFFYLGNNGNGSTDAIQGDDFKDLSTPVAASYFEVSVTGLSVTASVAASGDVFTETLNAGLSGTGLGLGFGNAGAVDNFYLARTPPPAPIPLPASVWLLTAGLGMLAARRR